jgi:hypothetical protein
VAEITTVLFTLVVGALAFQALTGMISMAPGWRDAMASTTAIKLTLRSARPLAACGMAFRTRLVTTVVGFVMAGSVVAAFAGYWLTRSAVCIHRRRLMRLIDGLR